MENKNRMSAMAMKRIQTFLVLILMALAGLTNASDSSVKLYQEKSGVITSEFRISFSEGSMTKIKEVFIWDEWGLKVAKYQLKEDGSGSKTVIDLKLVDEQNGVLEANQVASIKLPSGKAKRIRYRAVDIYNSFTAEQKKNLAVSFIEHQGVYKKTDRQEKVFGKTCDVWQSTSNKDHSNCIWKGLILSMKLNDSRYGHINEKIASEITIQDVDSKHFEVPGLLSP